MPLIGVVLSVCMCVRACVCVYIFTPVCSYYFQLLAAEAEIARGFLGIIRTFHWQRVAIITQNENLFTVVCVCRLVITVFVLLQSSRTVGCMGNDEHA